MSGEPSAFSSADRIAAFFDAEADRCAADAHRRETARRRGPACVWRLAAVTLTWLVSEVTVPEGSSTCDGDFHFDAFIDRDGHGRGAADDALFSDRAFPAFLCFLRPAARAPGGA